MNCNRAYGRMDTDKGEWYLMKKKGARLPAMVLMLLLIYVILITSFQLAIYGDPSYGFYRRTYEKYEVTENLDMSLDDVMLVTHHMMDYLRGKEDTLSLDIRVDGRLQDFFNQQDRDHMADVRRMFTEGLLLRNIALGLIGAGLIVLLLLKVPLKETLPRAYFLSLGLFLLLTAIIGGLFASDFTKYFTLFHELAFSNDLWQFDPAHDYMIRMLPEGFFAAMTTRIVQTFLVFLGLVSAAFGSVWLVVRRKQKNGRQDPH